MSLRRRLLLTVLGTVLAALAIVGVLTYVLVTRSQLQQVDDDLESAHPPIEEAATVDPASSSRAIRDVAPGFYVELRDGDGDSLLVVPLCDHDGSVLTLEGVDVPSPAAGAGDETVFASVDADDGDDAPRAIGPAVAGGDRPGDGWQPASTPEPSGPRCTRGSTRHEPRHDRRTRRSLRHDESSGLRRIDRCHRVGRPDRHRRVGGTPGMRETLIHLIRAVPRVRTGTSASDSGTLSVPRDSAVPAPMIG